ncbi:MAG: class I SAM-dependent methyltransferase [Pirellulales bacterium]
MPVAEPPELDQTQVDQFMQRLVGTLTSATTALMLSIGHRTGLFDALAGREPATSQQIAQWAGLNERYVREWLGAMVTARIIDFEAKRNTYQLPPAHAALLTRDSPIGNFGVTMQWISVLGNVEDKIIECFRSGGGVPYEQFHRFHEVMAEESGQTVVAALLTHIVPLVEGLQVQLEQGIEVLDVGCGSGRAICMLAEAYSKSRFIGYDLCEEAVDAAQQKTRDRGLKNVRFETSDVAKLGDRDRFDLITAFDAIHDQADPAQVLKGIHAALKPTGTFLMQDILASSELQKNFDNPLAPMLYTISCMHCMTVSLSQGGAGLGACWGRELAEKMLREAGFASVEVHKLAHDEMNYYYVVRKSE